MKTSFVNLLLSLVLSAGMAHGATHVVTPGQSLQAAINGAASGDTIVMAPPLIITPGEIDEMFRRFRLALDETL